MKDLGKIAVDKLILNPIGDEKIFHSVIINIKEQGAPAPVRFCQPCKISYFAKTIIAIIQLQGIVHVLVVKSILNQAVEPGCLHGKHLKIGSEVIIRSHLQGEYIQQAIVVDIC